MSFLNLMKNRLKPKEVDEALTRAVENTLPTVEPTDEGKVLTVNSSGEWGAKELPATDFSTTEKNTGIKWVDNSPIYRRVIVLETAQTLNSDNWVTIDEAILGINRIINGCVINESGAFYGSVIIAFDTQTSKIQIGNQSVSQPIANMKYIIVEYTKTGSTRKKTK